MICNHLKIHKKDVTYVNSPKGWPCVTIQVFFRGSIWFDINYDPYIFNNLYIHCMYINPNTTKPNCRFSMDLPEQFEPKTATGGDKIAPLFSGKIIKNFL